MWRNGGISTMAYVAVAGGGRNEGGGVAAGVAGDNVKPVKLMAPAMWHEGGVS
jgi:hypothetical protein